MTQTEPDRGTPGPLESAVDRIVAEGHEVRHRVAEALRSALQRAEPTTDRLSHLARQAFDGAASGLERALPENREAALRQVVDGVGDGLQQAAHATELALEEARSHGRAFCGTDLRGFSEDLEGLAKNLAGSVDRLLNRAQSLVREDMSGLRTHAGRTLESVRPRIEAAARSAREQPQAVVTESAQTAIRAAGDAVGGLLAAAGRFVQQTGEQLRDRSAAPRSGDRPGAGG